MPIFSTVMAILIFKEQFMTFHLIGTILILVPPIWHYGLGFFPLLFYDYGISIMVALYLLLIILGYTEFNRGEDSDFVTLIHAQNSDKDENI